MALPGPVTDRVDPAGEAEQVGEVGRIVQRGQLGHGGVVRGDEHADRLVRPDDGDVPRRVARRQLVVGGELA